MKSSHCIHTAAAAALVCSIPARAETQCEHDARMGWFRDVRFGTFIHWGLYSVPAGEWQGKQYGDGVEWIQDKSNLPSAEYERLLGQINPSHCGRDAWVRLAKEAGMNYISSAPPSITMDSASGTPRRPLGTSAPLPTRRTCSNRWPRPATSTASGFASITWCISDSGWCAVQFVISAERKKPDSLWTPAPQLQTR